MKKIGFIVGSLREGSFTKQIANNVKELFPADYEVEFIEIEQLPFYNQDFDDLEGNEPASYQAFRQKIKETDGFIFFTPEYNRSVPAVLKNALDVASRPKVENGWDKKPAGIVSQSPGLIGGFGANHHLRQVLSVLNMPVVQQPEVYLSQSMNLLDESGKITNDGTIQFLQTFVDEFLSLFK